MKNYNPWFRLSALTDYNAKVFRYWFNFQTLIEYQDDEGKEHIEDKMPHNWGIIVNQYNMVQGKYY